MKDAVIDSIRLPKRGDNQNLDHVDTIQANITKITKMYTSFLIGFNKQYGPYAHFGY